MTFPDVAKHCLQGVASAPLWDEESGAIIGMISASDFIHILRRLRSRWVHRSQASLAMCIAYLCPAVHLGTGCQDAMYHASTVLWEAQKPRDGPVLVCLAGSFYVA